MYTICSKGVQISPNTCNYLTTDIDGTQQFFLLPKIHKDPLNLPGKPIVSGSGGPIEKNLPIGGSLYRANSATFTVLC